MKKLWAMTGAGDGGGRAGGGAWSGESACWGGGGEGGDGTNGTNRTDGTKGKGVDRGGCADDGGFICVALFQVGGGWARVCGVPGFQMGDFRFQRGAAWLTLRGCTCAAAVGAKRAGRPRSRVRGILRNEANSGGGPKSKVQGEDLGATGGLDIGIPSYGVFAKRSHFEMGGFPGASGSGGMNCMGDQSQVNGILRNEANLKPDGEQGSVHAGPETGAPGGGMASLIDNGSWPIADGSLPNEAIERGDHGSSKGRDTAEAGRTQRAGGGGGRVGGMGRFQIGDFRFQKGRGASRLNLQGGTLAAAVSAKRPGRPRSGVVGVLRNEAIGREEQGPKSEVQKSKVWGVRAARRGGGFDGMARCKEGSEDGILPNEAIWDVGGES